MPGLKLGDGVGGDVVGERCRIRAVDFDFAHVADVEQAGGRSHGAVFFEDAGVLQRHVPAAEIDHFGAHPAMGGVKRGGFEWGGLGHPVAKLRTAESSSGKTSIT